MTKILITGGAGYIGSHAVKTFLENGYEVVVFDNFFRGYQQAIDTLKGKFGEKIDFIKGDLRNKNEISPVFKQFKIDGVIHFAALCLVTESMENPSLYFENNFYGSLNLISTMVENDVDKIVFSSTSEVYGENEYLPIDESHKLKPLNPYGLSKKMVEDMLSQFDALKGIRSVIFRYFNVTGASDDGLVGDSKKPSVLLVQNAVRGALGISEFKLTCAKVNTRDGTTIRDYVNVIDLVNAHILAYKYLENGGKSDVFNLGSEKGYSVKEIIDEVQKTTGVVFEVTEGEVRKGEPVEKYASAQKVKNILGWEPKHGIKESIESLVRWYKNRPNGWDY